MSKQIIAKQMFFLSGFAIWYLSLIVFAYAFAAFLFLPNLFVQLILFIIFVFVQLYLSIAFVRVLQRLWPLNLSDSDRRKFKKVLLLLFIYCISVSILWQYLYSDLAETHIRTLENNPFIFVLMILLVIVWNATIITIFVKKYLNSSTLFAKPFTLFLRRFSTISDRSVAHTVLSSSLPLRNTVMLVPKDTEPEDWNPVTVFMSGIRPWQPIQSCPVFIQLETGDWENAIARFIEIANTLVIDASDLSKAIRTELNLIDNAHAWPKTIVLIDAMQKDSYTSLLDKTPRAIIRYHCTWKNSLWRLVSGLFMVIPVAIPFSVPFTLLMMQLDRHISNGSLITKNITVIILLVIIGLLYKMLFFRPEMDQNSKHQLKGLL